MTSMASWYSVWVVTGNLALVFILHTPGFPAMVEDGLSQEYTLIVNWQADTHLPV